MEDAWAQKTLDVFSWYPRSKSFENMRLYAVEVDWELWLAFMVKIKLSPAWAIVLLELLTTFKIGSTIKFVILEVAVVALLN